MNIVNIAGYLFVSLPPETLSDLRERLKEQCLALHLKGTILISAEGINLFLAGARNAIDTFLQFLKTDDRFKPLYVKESLSDEQPFNRMLVKIKKEIISMGMPMICPEEKSAPRILPKELKNWLDEGREVVLLDTRNDYEIRLGTFQNAMDVGIHHFRSFPQAVESLDPSLKEKTVVTFCTGGIRCEKAALLLSERGFKAVYQLDGGILQYFEDCGGAHYDGECFVFDRRVAVNENLQETQTVQCFVCLNPVSPEEQQLPSYVPDISCPYCDSSLKQCKENTLHEAR